MARTGKEIGCVRLGQIKSDLQSSIDLRDPLIRKMTQICAQTRDGNGGITKQMTIMIIGPPKTCA
jgi:hypothetical protein